VCQSCNLATRAVASLEEQPLGAFRDVSVTVTINSDDPPMFGTTLNREYEVVAGLLDPDEAGLARVAVRASFAGDAVKSRILAEINAYAHGSGPWSGPPRGAGAARGA
jgi:aminodeoxyfutalosine deaminase